MMVMVLKGTIAATSKQHVMPTMATSYFERYIGSSTNFNAASKLLVKSEIFEDGLLRNQLRKIPRERKRCVPLFF
jgi:hypothetical protein